MAAEIDHELLLQQFHDNQSLWIARLATGQMYAGLSHPRIAQLAGTMAMMPGESGVIMLPVTGEPDEVLTNHDRLLEWIRRGEVNDVLVWGMKPDTTIDLAMLAQGYQVGFEPWWMTRDLTTPISAPKHIISLATIDDIRDLSESDVPFIVRDQLESTDRLITEGRHSNVIWLIVRQDERVVGQAIVNVMGRHAGLFNVGVAGKYRKRGIGTSLTLAAMQASRDRGASTMNLNSTPQARGVYERMGFQLFGVGQTWIRSGPAVFESPGDELQQLTTAVGRGDIAGLGNASLPSLLPHGMTPQQLASRFGQRTMLRHLIRMGHVPEIMALWDAGMKDEALAATRIPQARELIIDAREARPIHLAVERGAGTLVMALIDAGADMSVRDREFRATPLDWAHACNKPTIARILRQAGGR